MAQVEHRRTASGAGVGVLVALWAFADGLIIGLPVLLATVATGNALLAYAVGAMTYVLVNLGACRWLDDQWDNWVVGSSFERRLVALRARPRAARAVSAIERGTTRGYAIAAVLLSATQVVALHRVLIGEPTEPHQRTVASITPAVLYPALYALLGLLIHSVV